MSSIALTHEVKTRVSGETRERLEALARSREVSMSDIGREALRFFLASVPEPASAESPEARGQRAAREGAAITSNPYDMDRQEDEFGDWLQGYQQEHYELELAREGKAGGQV
jgi:predicted transcriptional regulator